MTTEAKYCCGNLWEKKAQSGKRREKKQQHRFDTIKYVLCMASNRLMLSPADYAVSVHFVGLAVDMVSSLCAFAHLAETSLFSIVAAFITLISFQWFCSLLRSLSLHFPSPVSLSLAPAAISSLHFAFNFYVENRYTKLYSSSIRS